MLDRYWTNSFKLGAVLVLYGVAVLLLDALGTVEIATLAIPLVLISGVAYLERKNGLRFSSVMLLPSVCICGTAALAYGSLNWIQPPSSGLAYVAFLLLVVSWVFAIYRAFSSAA